MRFYRNLTCHRWPTLYANCHRASSFNVVRWQRWHFTLMYIVIVFLLQSIRVQASSAGDDKSDVINLSEEGKTQSLQTRPRQARRFDDYPQELLQRPNDKFLKNFPQVYMTFIPQMGVDVKNAMYSISIHPS